MWAAFNGLDQVVQRALILGAVANYQAHDGATALIDASRRGHLAIVERLLRAGADPNLRNKDGNTAVQRAIEKGHGETIELLRRHGARWQPVQTLSVEGPGCRRSMRYAPCPFRLSQSMQITLRHFSVLVIAGITLAPIALQGDEPLKKAYVTGEGWTQLTLRDFVNVNGKADTWTDKDGVIVCTGKPNGGARTKQQYTNFEMVVEWKHHVYAGNSGVFLWCPESAFTDLPPGKLPRSGIEVQVLDLGYEENWLKSKGSHSNWFTSHGDVFPVGSSKMNPFTPMIEYAATDGTKYMVGNNKSSRSFPSQRRTNSVGKWNHYYIRAINGEVRLWVNGEEVNGGNQCKPATGYLALEAEGSLVEYRNLRIRELP